MPMEYISSDTNVWLDFALIDRLELPFRLRFIYLMHEDVIEDELLSPPGLGARLIALGLVKTELTIEEFFLAEEFKRKYVRTSTYDCIALAIAKNRRIILLTGDAALRRAAQAEGVRVMGTIGILDRLKHESRIAGEEYVLCIRKLLELNGGKVRLPKDELEKRLKNRR